MMNLQRPAPALERPAAARSSTSLVQGRQRPGRARGGPTARAPDLSHTI